MPTAADVCNMYRAIRLHFRSDSEYDYFKYRGKTRAMVKDGDSFKHQFYFQWVADHLGDRSEAYLAFLFTRFEWVRENGLTHDHNIKAFEEYWDYIQKLPEKCLEAIKAFNITTDDFVSEDGQHPGIFKLFLGGNINLEQLMYFINQQPVTFSAAILSDPVFNPIYNKILKVRPFLRKYVATQNH